MKIEIYPDHTKQAQILKLMQFGTVMIFVDSRHQDVIVPEHLKNDHQLRLNFDYAYEIDDFRVLPDRIEASLSFNMRNFFCVIPFTAVYLMICHNIQHGSLFTQSVPIEMLEYFAEQAKLTEAKVAEAKGAQSMPSKLDLPAFNVISGSSVSRAERKAKEPAAHEKKEKGKKRHLRLVRTS